MTDVRDEKGVLCQQGEPVIIKKVSSTERRIKLGNNPKDIDRGWSWVVLVAAFLTTVIVYGHITNSSIYFIIFLNTYNHSRSYTSWIITIQGFVIHVSGVISSVMLTKYGARRTMITGGVISSISLAVTYFADSITFVIATFAINGLGISLAMSSAVAAVSLYFKKYFNVAMAISNSGAGVGIMLMGTVLELTVVSYGWKGAMLIQAGIMMQVVVCGSLIFKRKANELPSGGAKCDNKPSMYEQHSEDGPTQGDRSRLPLYRFILKMCNNKQFVLLMVVFFLYFFYFNIYLLIQKDLFLNKHFDYTFEVIILCFGVSNIVGRVLSGFISEYVLVPTLQFVVSTTLASVAVIGLAYIQQAWMYFLLTVIFGFCVGQQASLFNLIIAHLFNRQLTPIFFSFGLVMGANGYIGGAPVAGYMIDATESYIGTMWLITIGCFVSGFLILACHFLDRKRVSTSRKEDLLNGQPMEDVKVDDDYND